MSSIESDGDFFKDAMKMYVCGPTVYDQCHLGHARTYITCDMVHRVMSDIMGIETELVMNITDIDDKIIKKASETNSTWNEVARLYEKSFFDFMEKLNIRYPSTIIRVSEVLSEIVKYIQKIIDNGFAYVATDGSVYFDSDAYVREGYDFGNMIDEEEQVFDSKVSESIAQLKKNKKDFALWKGRNPEEVGFDVEFSYNNSITKSRGRPGWHIECSTMVHETLGPELDIHFGGIDLKFPHHHNERIQANAYYHPLFKPNSDRKGEDQPIWAKTFMHIGHLCDNNGDKISKSKKNFTPIKQILNSINTNQVRWLFITHKWQDPMEYNDDSVSHARICDSTITNFLNRIAHYPFERINVKSGGPERQLMSVYYKTRKNIFNDLIKFKFDLAVTKLFDLINRVNTYVSSECPNEHVVRRIRDWVLQLLTSLGFVYQQNSEENLVGIMNIIVNTRSAIRKITRDKTVPKEVKQKLFTILDRERNDELAELGIILQDTKESSLWFVAENDGI